jgi:hypothetical protein
MVKTGWPEDPEKRAELERALDEGSLEELPRNVPPGILGERASDINLRKVDTGGPYGLNAGLLDEWTVQTTLMVVALTYVFFFPAAYVILWRSRKIARRFKVELSVVMTIGVLWVGARLLGVV